MRIRSLTERANNMATREFTGRKMLIVTVSAFAVIIAVNLTLAFKAVKTFPGLEVKNSYVASQTFDVEREAQEALGWNVTAKTEGEMLRLSIRDENGAPVEAAEIGGILGRATNVSQDQSPEFRFDGKDYIAQTGKLAPGNWNMRLVAKATDGTSFKQRVILYVPGARG